MSTVNTSSSTATSFTPPKWYDRVLGALQSVGRSLMLPIAVLPAAGLLLRLGQPDLLNLTWMAAAGNAIFGNLPMIFAIGIAIGLTGAKVRLHLRQSLASWCLRVSSTHLFHR